MTLGAFQDAFAVALADGEAHGALAALTLQPGFAVYRNTVAAGCVEALRAGFPAVARLVGDEWFGAAALEYARLEPARSPALLEYGEHFPDFLAVFAPAAELPYLPAVARLDRWWTEAHVAADETPLDAGALAGRAPEALMRMRLRATASARWGWFDLPAFSIWSRNRAGEGDGSDIAWRAEGALVTRPRHEVLWQPLGRAGVAFLDACRRGEAVAEACAAALDCGEPPEDLAALLFRLISAGTFLEDTA